MVLAETWGWMDQAPIQRASRGISKNRNVAGYSTHSTHPKWVVYGSGWLALHVVSSTTCSSKVDLHTLHSPDNTDYQGHCCDECQASHPSIFRPRNTPHPHSSYALDPEDWGPPSSTSQVQGSRTLQARVEAGTKSSGHLLEGVSLHAAQPMQVAGQEARS